MALRKWPVWVVAGYVAMVLVHVTLSGQVDPNGRIDRDIFVLDHRISSIETGLASRISALETTVDDIRWYQRLIIGGVFAQILAHIWNIRAKSRDI